MKKKCPQCKLVNYQTAFECVRCGGALTYMSASGGSRKPFWQTLLRRGTVLIMVCLAAIAGFYVSLVYSSRSMTYEQAATITASIDVLEKQGFSREAFLLRRLATFRSTDHWLNSSVVKENAFAATNFPFGIITVYADFFTYPIDDVERAAIMLHEAKHLEGADEKEAYEFVWRNREKLGWTNDKYGTSVVFGEIRKQTRDVSPILFVCDINPFSDCTETRKPFN